MVRHHFKLIISDKKHHEKDVLNAIDGKFNEQREGMKKQMDDCYSNLINVVKSTEEKSMAEDEKIHTEINEVKAGILSIEGAYFKQECRKMLSKEHINSSEFETLNTEHATYNKLGGNHDGDALFKLVEEKYKKQLFQDS